MSGNYASFASIVRDKQKKLELDAHLTRGYDRALAVIDAVEGLKTTVEAAATDLDISPKLFKFLGDLFDEGESGIEREVALAKEKYDAIGQLRSKEVL